jgi:tRNA (adenine57-N1/adenine58-N1)-methyltransferase
MENPKRKLIGKKTTYFIKDNTVDYHCKDGMFSKEDLKKTHGSVFSNKKIEFKIIIPNFSDEYMKIKRGAAIIQKKDLGYIAAECNINKNSVIFESGSGSGAATIFLASISKFVHSYELREDHLKIVKKNLETLNIDNVSLQLGDVYEEISNIETEIIDTALLDLPEPQKAIKQLLPHMKLGGYIVTYSPCITQIMEYVKQIKEDYNEIEFLYATEIIKRDWTINNRIVRPNNNPQHVHTAFLSFSRVIDKTTD